MGRSNVIAKKCVLCDKLKYNGETLLTYKIEFPEFTSSCYKMSVRKVNMFCLEKALEFQYYCETVLFDEAVQLYNDAIANGFPIRVFEAQLACEVTYLCSCIISVYFDRYEYTGGAHGNTIRTSETWNLRSYGLIELPQLVRCLPDYKSYVLAMVKAQIAKEPDIYFENYEELICENFNENSFYCTRRGIVLYYQQYDIAPYSSGIREFLIPYTCCVINPEKLCCVS